MGRGLDGFFDPRCGGCAVLKDRSEGWSLEFSGGFGEGETPLPIPNREVKPLSADGTWLARARESRTPPVYFLQSDLAGRLRKGGPSCLWGRTDARRVSGANSARRRGAGGARGTLRQGRPARTPPAICRPAARSRRRRGGAGARGGLCGLHAAAPGADDLSAARSPGRPPSRRRCRARATGRSAAAQPHRTRAAGSGMSSLRGTCVRKAMDDSGRTPRTRVRSSALGVRIWLHAWESEVLSLQALLQGGDPHAAGGCRRSDSAGRCSRGRREPRG